MAVICSGVGPFLTVGSGTASMSSSCGRPSASANPSPGSKVLSAGRPSGCDSNSRCASSCSCWDSQRTASALTAHVSLDCAPCEPSWPQALPYPDIMNIVKAPSMSKPPALRAFQQAGPLRHTG